MSLASKILWSEGLTLGPQQFQQQDRYHEMRLHRVASALNAHLWGVRSVQWNVDALADNRLVADNMSLIFQDGDLYEAPAADSLPAPVDLGGLPLSEQAFTFNAALPALKAHGGNLAADARYAQTEADTLDLFTEGVSIEVAFLKKSVCLLSHLESHDAYVSFPVIRVRRMARGGFEIDPGFMPPSVSIGAVDGLQLMLDSLIGKLNAKIESLYSLHRQSNKSTFEVHSGDISSFWMLNTISTASASLLHFARSRTQHPEVLFEKLMTLAGGLMTFSNKYAMVDLPAYSHAEPGPAFASLDAIIRDLVDIVISSKYFTVPLIMDEQRTTHYRGALDPAKVDRQTELCLAVNADMPALELVAAVPRLFKVGSPDNIERIVVSALPGAELVHMAQVPSAVPVRPNTYYFSIENKGVLYESILKSQAIAIYVPAGMKALKLELLAITP
ncbi:MAG: type VI secretion system baseplate subunit TssK [Telluria sp.]